jgi:hypothetical protein
MTAPAEGARRRAGQCLKSANRVLLASLLSLLGGCAACMPAAKGEIMPVRKPCITMRPTAPVLPAVPDHGIFEQVQVLLAREQLRAAHVRQLEMLLDACSGG